MIIRILTWDPTQKNILSDYYYPYPDTVGREGNYLEETINSKAKYKNTKGGHLVTNEEGYADIHSIDLYIGKSGHKYFNVYYKRILDFDDLPETTSIRVMRNIVESDSEFKDLLIFVEREVKLYKMKIILGS